MVDSESGESSSYPMALPPKSKLEEDPAKIKEYAAEIQQKEGDCLAQDFQSTLPEFVNLDLQQNDVKELAEIWEKWPLKAKELFEKKYGQIACLLQVKIDEELLRAVTQFWDPSYRCFTFNKIDMTPTIEEYTELIGSSASRVDKMHWKNLNADPKKELASILDVSKDDIRKWLTKKGNDEYMPWDTILRILKSHGSNERAIRIMALAIYGLILFPKALGHIDLAVVDLFNYVEHQTNPAHSLLAETFRSLNFCRNNGKGRFIGCAHFLYIWARSHFKQEKHAFRHPNFPHCPIKEFCRTEWPKQESKEIWVEKLRKMKNSEVAWIAPWMPRKPMMYACEATPWIPLLGPWGGISYAPLMVRRQLGSEQFIPMTHGLDQMEFSYNTDEGLVQAIEVSKIWKTRYTIQTGNWTNKTAPGYEEWHTMRGKNVVVPGNPHRIITKRKKSWSTAVEREQERLKWIEKETSWLGEKEFMQKQLDILNKKVDKDDLEIRKLRASQEAAKKLKSDMERTYETFEKCIGDLEEDNNNLNYKLQKSQDEYVALKSKSGMAKVTSENKTLREQIRRLKRDMVEKDQRLEQVDNSNQQLRVRLQWLEHDMDAREIQLEEIRHDNGRLRQFIQNLEAQERANAAMIERLSRNCNDLARANQKGNVKYQMLEDVLTNFQEAHGQLQDICAEYKKIGRTWGDELVYRLNEAAFLEKQREKVASKAREMLRKIGELKKLTCPTEARGKEMVELLDEVMNQYQQVASLSSSSGLGLIRI